MKNLVNYKRLSKVAIPIVLVCAVAASLWFASPTLVKALQIAITNPASGTLGDTYSFTVKVDIESGDLLPVKSIDLMIMDNPDPNAAVRKATCQDLPIPSGAGVTDSKQYTTAQTGGGEVTVEVLTASWWGYGITSRQAYGYMYPGTGWGTQGGYHFFGPSGGWGYGYGSYQGPTSITYNVTWSSPSSWSQGTYYIVARVYPNSGPEYFAETASFTLSTRAAGGGAAAVPSITDSKGIVKKDTTVKSADGKCSVFIPKGTKALTKAAKPLSKVTVTKMADPPAPPTGSNIIGLTYNLGPDGATFDPPITLTFTYDPGEVPEGATPVIAFWDEDASKWAELAGCVVDEDAGTISAPVSHFTAFTILSVVTPPIDEEYEAALAALAEAETSKTQAEADLAAAQAQATSLQDDVDAAEAKVASLQDDIASAQSKVTSLQSDLHAAQTRLTAAQEQLAELEVPAGIAWWLWVIIGLAAVAVVGGIIWLVVRRRIA